MAGARLLVGFDLRLHIHQSGGDAGIVEMEDRQKSEAAGTLLFTGASASLRGRSGYGAFNSSKAGLRTMAQAMGISVWTVHGHIKKIFERLGVRTRTEAVVRYLEK